jgi:pimeloyl-ACP methyl ester carboxylesterase
MGPDPSVWKREDFEKMNQYLVKSIKNVPNMIMDLMLPSMLSSPEHNFRDIIHIFKGMHFSLDQLFDELIAFDHRDLGIRFELPFFVFQGDTDILTPTVTAKAYFAEIEAPHKEFVYIKNAGHLACFARPDQFLQELIRRVLPVASDFAVRGKDKIHQSIMV